MIYWICIAIIGIIFLCSSKIKKSHKLFFITDTMGRNQIIRTNKIVPSSKRSKFQKMDVVLAPGYGVGFIEAIGEYGVMVIDPLQNKGYLSKDDNELTLLSPDQIEIWNKKLNKRNLKWENGKLEIFF